MAEYQDGWHHVKVEDWSKLSGVQFWLQVSMLIPWVVIAISVISGNGCIQDGGQDDICEVWSATVLST